MNTPAIVIGVGEIGAVFARGLLRLGHPVYPANRDTDLSRLALAIPEPAVVLVSVGERDLSAVLQRVPPAWHAELALLQNELLPADFSALSDATVISVWFEKKKGQDAKVILPSPVYGPKAVLLHDALASIAIPARILTSPDDLLFELVLKNLYILTSNIAGLRVGGTVGELWRDHREVAEAIAADVIALQAELVGKKLDAEALIAGMRRAFDGDPDHQCMGRSAPLRLARAIQHADRLRLDVAALRDIQRTAMTREL